MTDAAPAEGLDTVIVTGLSGAGRSTAAKCFEDLGYFVVDNLPAELIATLVDLGSRTHGAVTRLAVVMDVRSRAFSTDLRGVIRDLDERGHASAGAVPRGDRRGPGPPLRERAPGAPDAGRRAAGRRHRRRARAARAGCATTRIWCSTRSNRSVHDLRRAIETAFASGGALGAGPSLRATVVSFGFKYGLPVDADLVVDVRFLPNPYWIPELRELTGNDQEVARLRPEPGGRASASSTGTPRSCEIIGAGYRRESKRYLTLAVGCTGGKHRSVVMAAGTRQAARGRRHPGHRRAPGPRP